MEYLRYIYPEVLNERNATSEFFYDILKETKTKNDLTSSYYSPNEQGIRIIFNELVANSSYPWKNKNIEKRMK